MDQDRQIRFAIPPFFLFASLLWGAYLSSIFKPGMAKEVLGVLAVAAVAIVPMGFLISALSVTLLRLLALLTRTPTYEANLKESTLERIWAQLNTSEAKDKKMTLYAAATYDHELLEAGIHTWLLRRWNSFNVAAHSIVALLLAHILAPIFSIPQTCTWVTSTFALVTILFIHALCAWRETMRMIEFQSYRSAQNRVGPDSGLNSKS